MGRDRFPAIVLAARRLKAESFVIDGEVVVLREDGRSDFNALRGKHRNDDAVLLAFDLVECKGKDLRDVPLIDRKRKPLRLLGKTMTGIQFLDHFPDDGESVFRHACLMGLEGIISKRIDAPYRSGPSTIRWERQCDARPRTIGTRDIESALLALVKLNAESSPNATFGHHRAARR